MRGATLRKKSAAILQNSTPENGTMTPASELIECTNCDCWFMDASLEDVFYHATCACRRDLPSATQAHETNAAS
jgi:hypothetical protein